MAAGFTFRVGAHEQHEVGVNVTGIRNRVTISVDGTPVIDSGGNTGILMPNVFDRRMPTPLWREAMDVFQLIEWRRVAVDIECVRHRSSDDTPHRPYPCIGQTNTAAFA